MSYSAWWRLESSWRHATAFVWHAVSALVLVWAYQLRVTSPLHALWYVLSFQFAADFLALRTLFYCAVFVGAQQLVLAFRIRACAAAARSVDVGAWAWRVVSACTELRHALAFVCFPLSALLTVWAHTELTPNGSALLWPRPTAGADAHAHAHAHADAALPPDAAADELLCVLYGIAAFALCAALRAVFAREYVLQFPAAGLGAAQRVRRAKSALVTALLSSARGAALFAVCWAVAYHCALRVLLPRALGLALVRGLTAVNTSATAAAAGAHGDGTATVIAAAATALSGATAAAATSASAAAASAAAAAATAAPAAAGLGVLFWAHAAAALRLAYWALLLGLCWSWARVMCDLFYTEPIAFDGYLLRAVVDVRNPYLRHMALHDLQDVAEFSVARRRDLFAPLTAAASDVTAFGADGTWRGGAAAGGGVVNGAPGVASAAGAASPAAGTYFQWPSRAEVAPVCRAIVVVSSTNELAIGVRGVGGARESVSADERCARAMASPYHLVLETCLSAVAALTEQLYAQAARKAGRSASAAAAGTGAAAGVSSGSDGSSAWSLSALLDSEGADAYGLIVASAEQRAEQMFASLPVVTASVQAVSHLCVAALSEDASGIACRGVGDVLCTLLACSTACDEYTGSGNFMSSRAALRLHGQSALRPALVSLSFHLDNALYRLVAAYYEQLSTYILPPHYAQRLQSYLNFTK